MSIMPWSRDKFRRDHPEESGRILSSHAWRREKLRRESADENPWKETAPGPEQAPAQIGGRLKFPPLPRIDHVIVGTVALALVLAIGNTVLSVWNQSLQTEVNQRQQFINQSIQLSRVYENLVRGLASASIANKDDKLRNLLAVSGITVQANAPSDKAVGANGSGAGDQAANNAASPVRAVSATGK